MDSPFFADSSRFLHQTKTLTRHSCLPNKHISTIIISQNYCSNDSLISPLVYVSIVSVQICLILIIILGRLKSWIWFQNYFLSNYSNIFCLIGQSLIEYIYFSYRVILDFGLGLQVKWKTLYLEKYIF